VNNAGKHRIEPVDEFNLIDAAEVHAASWRESHREICSPEFVAAHTAQRQAGYLQVEIDRGKRMFLLTDGAPVGIVSVFEDWIENLYVHPNHWRKGYGTLLLSFAESKCKAPRLRVLSSNKQAIRFYVNHGYQYSGREMILSETLKELEMRKALL